MRGGSLASKPMWSNTSGCSATSAFLFLLLRDSCNEQGRLIMYIGGGLLTLVIVVVLVMFVLRR